jgi:hypothetical protein
MAKFEIPEGCTVQAFRFTLDPTDDQSRMLHGISVPGVRPITGPSQP